MVGAGELRVKGERVSEGETLRVMRDILENKFSLVDLSKLNERQERSNMKAVTMGLLAYDDRSTALRNGERSKCGKILRSTLETMRLEFTRQCPEVASALHSRLEKRCLVAAKTAADHVRDMFKPLNWSSRSSGSSCKQVTLRTLRNREDARAELFLPLLLIELLADFHFYLGATKTDESLQKIEETMGYISLVPLALQELEMLARGVQGGQDAAPTQDKSVTARESTKRTRKRSTSRSATVHKRPKVTYLDTSRSNEESSVALAGDQGTYHCVALDDHLLQLSTPHGCDPVGAITDSGIDGGAGMVAQASGCDPSVPERIMDYDQDLDLLDFGISFSGADMMRCVIAEMECPHWHAQLC